MANASVIMDMGFIEGNRQTAVGKIVYFFDTYAHAKAANQAMTSGEATDITELSGIVTPKYLANDASAGIDIQDVSRTSKAKITWKDHGLLTGDKVTISDVSQSGYTDLNDTLKITKIDNDTFYVNVDTSDAAAAYDADTDTGVINPGDYKIRVDVNGILKVVLDNGAVKFAVSPGSAFGGEPILIPTEMMTAL